MVRVRYPSKYLDEWHAATLSKAIKMNEFDWDEANTDHLARHKISRIEAEEVFRNEPLDLQRETRNGEERLTQAGETNRGRILVIVSTWRGDAIRVVTGWDAEKSTKTYYLKHRVDNYGIET
jgi:uncharacterized protein